MSWLTDSDSVAGFPGSYGPPAVSALDAGITEEFYGTAQDWERSGFGLVSISTGGSDRAAILTEWSILMTDDIIPTFLKISIRVVSPDFASPIKAQLYSAGNVIGDELSMPVVQGSSRTLTLDEIVNEAGVGWNTNLSVDEIEAAGFGIKLTFTDPQLMVVRGVPIEPRYESVAIVDAVQAKSYFQASRVLAKPYFAVDAVQAEPYWQPSRVLANER